MRALGRLLEYRRLTIHPYFTTAAIVTAPASAARALTVFAPYVPPGGRVLDVGSMTTGAMSARDPFSAPASGYVGLDVEPAANVDFVPADPYRWDELEKESFDAVVSANCFEHNPYFRITMAEIARVLKIGGYACIVTPSRGGVHRYPLDCWRLYPDATAALAAYTGLEAVESYTKRPRFRKVTFGQRWRDHLTITRKPELSDPDGFRPPSMQRNAASRSLPSLTTSNS